MTWRVLRKFAYPLTAVYLGAVAVMAVVANGWIDAATGAGWLFGLAVLTLLIATRREVHTVHALVNSKSDAQLERIEQLIETLKEAGVAVPPGLTGEAPAGKVAR